MPRSQKLLAQVAAAVADRETVDWDRVDQRSKANSLDKDIAALRLLERVSSSRTAVRDPGEGSARDLSQRTLPLYLKALIVLALTQVILAILVLVIGYRDSPSLPEGLVLSTAVLYVACAMILGLAGKGDTRTRPLAGFLLVNASAQTFPFLSQLASVLPAAIPATWFTALLPECFIPLFLWHFVARFPKVIRLDRWSAWIDRATTASLWCGIGLFLLNAGHRLGLLGLGSQEAASRLLRGDAYWALLFALALPALVIALLRARRVEDSERRRVRTFMLALLIGVLPLFTIVLADSLVPAADRLLSRPRVWLGASVIVYTFLLSIPVTTTYAVVARRVLTLRLVVHRAVRLTLARATLLVLASAPSLLLAWRLWAGRDRSLVDILALGSSRALLGTAVLGGLLYAVRRPLLASLERGLLGRRRSSDSVFATFAKGAASARHEEELAKLLNEAVTDLLRPERTDLFVRDPETGHYWGRSGSARSMDRDSAVSCLIEASPDAFSVDNRDRDSLWRWLPEADRRWLETNEMLLLAPIHDGGGEPLGLLALGPARSGLPYAPSEREIAGGLASASSLALKRLAAERGRHASPGRVSTGPAGQCLACGSVAESAEGTCRCGEPLAAAVIPFILEGKFRLESILGAGGMGVVYLATDLTLGRRVALKTLPRLGDEALARLRQEARSMARFVHPHLALIFGAEVWGGVPVLVVEYLAGGTLDSRLDRPMAPREALSLGAKLASALAAMHREGLLHRDVKPSNVGFTREDEAKLLDFGLARLADQEDWSTREELPSEGRTRHLLAAGLTGTHRVVGTPLYLSPEALSGEGPTVAQDLWSLHILLWEALVGRHPCSGLPLALALRRLRGAEIADVRSALPECPDWVAELIARGLDADLDARAASADEVHETLTRALQRPMEI